MLSATGAVNDKTRRLVHRPADSKAAVPLVLLLVRFGIDPQDVDVAARLRAVLASAAALNRRQRLPTDPTVL